MTTEPRAEQREGTQDPNRLRTRIEAVLWATRLLMGFGVAGLVVTAAVVTWATSVDVIDLVTSTLTEETSSSATVADVVKILDGYLLVAILLLVAFGLYDQFVDHLDPAHAPSRSASGILISGSLDDLKDKVAKLVVLVLVIEFLQRALRMDLRDAEDLFLLGAGIALVSLGLLLVAGLERLRR